MAGAQNLISVSPKIGQDGHAARQLARPLEEFSMRLEDPAARIFPSAADLSEAQVLLSGLARPLVAIHPGSGSKSKNWPLERWLQVQAEILRNRKVGHLLVIGGESDFPQLSRMRRAASSRQTVLTNLPLPLLGSVLSRCSLFIGHDSGVSHLAAAAGARCLLIFGPTNPDVWAPANDAVEVLRADDAQISSLETELVLGRMNEMLNDVSRNDCRPLTRRCAPPATQCSAGKIRIFIASPSGSSKWRENAGLRLPARASRGPYRYHPEA